MTEKLIAIVPAAGVGKRASRHDGDVPKQYRQLRGEPVLRLAVQALLADARVSQVRVAVAPGDGWAAEALAGLPRVECRPCGGVERADTVANALADAALHAGLGERDWVLVHDAARPGLPVQALARLIDACLADACGGLLALPAADTVKQGRERVARTLPRDEIWLAQTPQMFRAGLLRQALAEARAAGVAVTDEASAMEAAGHAPLLVRGSPRNAKLTWSEDFEWMENWG
ncbi:2-C-methyl-D-erythritol 4-phosphate cytidylyltransferase [Kerstersia gyiorum]|uniref:2-C-methyl-D-erythritol 4-phosphate cytidylyltransferase n=1 Tax=Kerstersia gyiorum TaxID=206506 RepID=A0A171KVY1_9BURK|nr:2-C-methyl-D-erythritol 4-phosphate cytidylyltransferase [Kerstersia gyiorum]AZV94705.1 2-C-methyl-D-erythritol 4-phosphate cytidylyltransferase [Bordetella sp. J329]MCO7635559.1 2-C-methyl-D-erythritol 4-phosphate cytidylyltransferase [Pseudomonas sp. S 311-6]KAB0541886.1 2-C-methyl-D-erythritol 4-phosphate cytidylyltransferase [Kerstersia gyiorum]KKO73048.1 2-C-methyl-D-erythritol 4-phosphate cytidylyltransferase [Kerstersia gyiorum]MCP1632440.1 2-C-methyl-D-erythritol 4-phosphate cytidyl